MSWIGLGLVGGVVALDSTSCAQSMISRPLVAGPLMGLVLGEPAAGAMVGAVLEVFHLGILPIGAARYPEAGTAAVTATWAYTALDAVHGSALLLAIAFALLWERLTGASVVKFRELNDHVLRAGSPPPTARSLQGRHLLTMVLDFLRGAIMCLMGGAIGAAIVRLTATSWPLGEPAAHGLLIAATVTVAAGALTIFGGWRERWRLFVTGLASGLLLLVLT
jgi:mannose/fructose/N-acetylgalactosamine-specific phosphotransferase system component IIC